MVISHSVGIVHFLARPVTASSYVLLLSVPGVISEGNCDVAEEIVLIRPHMYIHHFLEFVSTLTLLGIDCMIIEYNTKEIHILKYQIS